MDDSERAMEIEALSAIFIEGEELQILNESELIITCNPRRQDGSQGCSMRLKFTLPSNYPVEESANYEIVDAVGLSEEDRERIVGVMDDVIEQNQGMPMLYPIVEAVNEELAHCIMTTEHGEAESDDGDGEDAEVAGSGDSLDTGLHLKQLVPEQERVTKEMFEEWSRKFRLEMIKKGIWRDVDARASKGQMTGREIFETKSADLDFDENENVFWNNEALYEGDCDEVALD
ncbi:rwd domain-containing protein [Babesia caballi]|uniref:Rwd domain-containing protein n=1 Tax=Babesia caballi TaxID=5871 RepID=A0AAV4M0S3_BABCB|nr:rwd domain-containing protein [Babesia caballi]